MVFFNSCFFEVVYDTSSIIQYDSNACLTTKFLSTTCLNIIFVWQWIIKGNRAWNIFWLERMFPLSFWCFLSPLKVHICHNLWVILYESYYMSHILILEGFMCELDLNFSVKIDWRFQLRLLLVFSVVTVDIFISFFLNICFYWLFWTKNHPKIAQFYYSYYDNE